jgi:hypothetical protein
MIWIKNCKLCPSVKTMLFYIECILSAMFFVNWMSFPGTIAFLRVDIFEVLMDELHILRIWTPAQSFIHWTCPIHRSLCALMCSVIGKFFVISWDRKILCSP